jgi:hypothetical protein
MVMLVIAIVMLGIALSVAAFTVAGTVSAGALIFALGFALLAVIAGTSLFTRRDDIVSGRREIWAA